MNAIIKLYLSEISAAMNIAISGALRAPAITAAVPIKAKFCGERFALKRKLAAIAKMYPQRQPAKIVGANLPAIPPPLFVAPTANPLSNRMPAIPKSRITVLAE